MPRQAKSPSLTQDLLMLGDVYLTLAWLGIQRLRHGPLWPWETPSKRLTGRVVTLRPPQDEGREEHETAGAKRE